VQHGYAVVRLLDVHESDGIAATVPLAEAQPGNESAGLEPLDEVRFGQPLPAAETLGVIEQVVDQTLFSARLVPGRNAELRAPLGLWRGGRTIGVAILLEVIDRRALGFVVSGSLTELPMVGDELSLSP
jgi:hypothetical protein